MEELGLKDDTPDLSQERKLVARAQAGDREAFWSLAGPSLEPIYRLAQRLTRSREDAEDVTQETLLKALASIDEFRGGSRFTTWVHRIAVNQALMKLRRRRDDVFSIDATDSPGDEPVVDLAAWSESALDDLVTRETQGVLEEELRKLPIDLRTVVVMRDINGLSVEETATALELPTNAVKWRLERARGVLRQGLAGYFREEKARRARRGTT